MQNILNEIKWAYQRVIKGYDNRIHWEFDTYFSQFIPALKEFCENELKNEKIFELNHKRADVFSTTLELIKEYEKEDYIKNFYKENNATTRLWEYFGKHIGYYWN